MATTTKPLLIDLGNENIAAELIGALDDACWLLTTRRVSRVRPGKPTRYELVLSGELRGLRNIINTALEDNGLEQQQRKEQ